MATILNARNVELANTTPRLVATDVSIGATTSVFTKLKNTSTVTPSTATLNSTIKGFTTPTYVWEWALSTAPTAWTTLAGQTTASLVVTNTWFTDTVGAASAIIFRCTVSQATYTTVSTTYTIGYIKEANDGTSGPTQTRIQLFLASTTAPVQPTSVQYTISTGALGTQTGGTAGWSLDFPSLPGPNSSVYMTAGIATSLTPDTAVSVASLSTPVVVAKQGNDGSPGASVYRAYIAGTMAAPPSTPGTTTSGAAPAGWSLTPVSLSANQVQYQSDGVMPVGTTTTTWNTPYPSTFKVGSLAAWQVSTGALTVDNTLTLGTNGAVRSTAYGGNGVFLGYDVSTYKFSVSNGSSSLLWDGTNLTVTGMTIKDLSGNTLFSAGGALNIPNTVNNVPSGWLNSNVGLPRGGALNANPECSLTSEWQGGVITTNIAGVPNGTAIGAAGPGVDTNVYSAKIVPISSNRKYRVSAKAFANISAGLMYLGIYWHDYNGNGMTSLPVGPGWGAGTFAYFGLIGNTPNTSVTDYSGEFGAGTTFAVPTNAAGIKLIALLNYNNTGGSARHYVTDFRVEDITDVAAAQSTASSAQTTASSAATAASNAQSTASSAATAASNAQSTASSAATAAANAQTAANNAQSTANTAATNAANALTAIGYISSDSVLSKSEKPAVYKELITVDNEYASIIAQASSLGVDSSSYATARVQLYNYLNSIRDVGGGGDSSSWANVNTDSSINPTDFRNAWVTYYTYRQSLLNAISAKAATMAQIAGLGGYFDQSKWDIVMNGQALIRSAHIGQLSTNNLTVSTLSNVVNANTSAGNARVVIDTNSISIYGSGGALRVRLAA